MYRDGNKMLFPDLLKSRIFFASLLEENRLSIITAASRSCISAENRNVFMFSFRLCVWPEEAGCVLLFPGCCFFVHPLLVDYSEARVR